MIIPEDYNANLQVILEKCASFGFSPVEYFRDYFYQAKYTHKIISDNFQIRNIYEIGAKGSNLALEISDNKNYFYNKKRKKFK